MGENSTHRSTQHNSTETHNRLAINVFKNNECKGHSFELFTTKSVE